MADEALARGAGDRAPDDTSPTRSPPTLQPPTTWQRAASAFLAWRSGSPSAMDELVTKGTATSIPFAPWIALGVFTTLARSRRWWGTVAVVLLCLLGPLFVIGGMGEAFAPANPYVSRAVLVTSGVVAAGLGLPLLASGVADLVDRRRTSRQPA